MIVHIDFARRAAPATVMDCAVREAAAAYADQLLDGGRRGFPLVVRDEPADAHYQRASAIRLEQIDHVTVGNLSTDEQLEVSERSYHEKFVALATAIAFQRRTGQATAAMATGLAGLPNQPSSLADSEAISRRLCSWTSDREREVWLVIHMARADRFLDRNWRQICLLGEAAIASPVGADGYRVLPAQKVEAILRRRPVKLSKEERARIEARRSRMRRAAGRDIARHLSATPL